MPSRLLRESIKNLNAVNMHMFSGFKGEASDREVRRRGAIDDRCNDARRKEGKGGEQADVPFALPLPLMWPRAP